MMPFALPYFLESRSGMILISLLFYVWMIYHCATRETNPRQKTLWLLLVILVPDIGALIYFLVRVVKIRG